MSPESSEGNILWGDDSLRVTTERYYGVGADSDLGDLTRFSRETVRVIRNRIREAGGSLASVPGLFFLKPGGPVTEQTPQITEIPMLDNGLSSIEGRLLFVGPVAAHAFALDIDEWDDAEVFAYAVDDLALRDVPAVLFEPRTSVTTVRLYRYGLNHLDDFELLRFTDAPVTLDEVFEAVESVHKTSLFTPKAQGSDAPLWEKPRKKWVSRYAERRVQLRLKAGFAAKFVTCVVREEQDESAGRLDLEIEETDPSDRSRVVRHVLVELKVIRSINSEGNNVSWADTRKHIADGVVQATTYREERGTRESGVCCFDMRIMEDERDCFEDVRDEAGRHKVGLKSWVIYSSDKEFRESLMASR